jgi:hypothetical protein
MIGRFRLLAAPAASRHILGRGPTAALHLPHSPGHVLAGDPAMAIIAWHCSLLPLIVRGESSRLRVGG